MADDSRDSTALSHIEPDIRGLAVPIDDLRMDEHQARKHGRRSIDEIKRSLEVHGQKVPLVVQRDGLVTKAGHGRIVAARELGWTHLAVVRSDDAPELLRQYAIRDNRSAEHAEWELDALARELEDLELDCEDVGFTEEELAGVEFTDEDLEGPDLDDRDEFGAGADDDTNRMGSTYQVVVECADEADLDRVLAFGAERGWKCRALIM